MNTQRAAFGIRPKVGRIERRYPIVNPVKSNPPAVPRPTDTPGYTIERVVPTMGHTGGGHCEIRLEGVRVHCQQHI